MEDDVEYTGIGNPGRMLSDTLNMDQRWIADGGSGSRGREYHWRAPAPKTSMRRGVGGQGAHAASGRTGQHGNGAPERLAADKPMVNFTHGVEDRDCTVVCVR